MTTMVTELYSALKDAEAVANYDSRFTRIEAGLLVLKWMIGAVLAGVVSLIMKSFII